MGRPYSLPEYEPLWDTAEALGMPIGLHTATARQSYFEGITTTIGTYIKEGVVTPLTAAMGTQGNNDFEIRRSLSEILMSGVCDRHPSIQIGSVEFNAAWAAYHMWNLDRIYKESDRGLGGKTRFSNDMIPSDFFHRNVFYGYQEDSLAIELRHIIGVENLQWGSDYPHIEGTFPESRRILAEILDGVPEEEQMLITSGNVTRLYHLPTS